MYISFSDSDRDSRPRSMRLPWQKVGPENLYWTIPKFCQDDLGWFPWLTWKTAKLFLVILDLKMNPPKKSRHIHPNLLFSGGDFTTLRCADRNLGAPFIAVARLLYPRTKDTQRTHDRKDQRSLQRKRLQTYRCQGMPSGLDWVPKDGPTNTTWI